MLLDLRSLWEGAVPAEVEGHVPRRRFRPRKVEPQPELELPRADLPIFMGRCYGTWTEFDLEARGHVTNRADAAVEAPLVAASGAGWVANPERRVARAAAQVPVITASASGRLKVGGAASADLEAPLVAAEGRHDRSRWDRVLREDEELLLLELVA